MSNKREVIRHDFLGRRATLFGLFVFLLVGISQACGERGIDPISPDLLSARFDSTNLSGNEAQQLDTVKVTACPSDMVGTYPDCYYENPPPSGPGCDPNFDPNCGTTTLVRPIRSVRNAAGIPVLRILTDLGATHVHTIQTRRTALLPMKERHRLQAS